MATPGIGYCELWMAFTTTGDTQNMYTSMGIKKSTVAVLSQSDADALLTIVRDVLKLMVSSSYFVGPGHIIDGIPGGTNRLDGTIAPAAGSLSASCLPQNCAYLFRKLSASGGRMNRGRGYIPGIPEGDVSTVGILSGTSLTAFQTAMNDYQTNLEASVLVDNLVLLHNDASTPTVITDLSAKTTIATQRRRLRP